MSAIKPSRRVNRIHREIKNTAHQALIRALRKARVSRVLDDARLRT